VRPINLIPEGERRGQQADLRKGPVAYIVVGALVAMLVGVTALVLTGNQISDGKSELAQLKREDAAAQARAERLAAYTQFRSISEQRIATVSSLADSRFDWERVMRELALVLPHSVWLVKLTGTAGPGVAVGGGAGGGGGGSSSSGGLRAAAPGPALEISGCAENQNAVAAFVTALKDIDGVTRVGVQSSKLAESQEGGGGSAEEGSSSAGGEECRTRRFIAKFEIVVAFDAAPIPLGASPEGEVAAAPVEPEAETAPASTETAGG
jgi:Tfp pilus assembly protein PilN